MISLIIPYMALMSRLSGSGFGSRWGLSWLPEALFTLPFGLSLGYALIPYLSYWAVIPMLLSWAWSYIFMQSGTWPFLRWTQHLPNTERKSTLKPIVDFIAKPFGYKLGDEVYSWISAGVKGFLIGLPVGGIPLAILWPLGYEIGSHFKYPYGDSIKEIAAGAGAGLSILLFLTVIGGVFG